MATTTAPAPTTAPAAAGAVAVVHAAASILGEGPLYDERTGRVLHVDIAGRKIFSVAYGDDGPADPRLEAVTPEDVGCIALTGDPAVVLAAFARTVVAVRLGAAAAAAAAAVSPPLATLDEGEGVADMRFNDGKVSPKGAFIVGRLHSKWRDGHTGAVYRLDVARRALVRVLDGAACAMPNGMAWIRDAGAAGGHTFFLVDSARRAVTAHATDAATAAPLAHPPGRVVVRTPDAVPDGMDADARGRLWIALAETGTVAAYDPATGARVAAVSTLPTLTRVTSCAFGGPNLGTLFVSSREEKGDGASAVAGALLAVDAGVAGGGGATVVAAPDEWAWGV